MAPYFLSSLNIIFAKKGGLVQSYFLPWQPSSKNWSMHGLKNRPPYHKVKQLWIPFQLQSSHWMSEALFGSMLQFIFSWLSLFFPCSFLVLFPRVLPNNFHYQHPMQLKMEFPIMCNISTYCILFLWTLKSRVGAAGPKETE